MLHLRVDPDRFDSMTRARGQRWHDQGLVELAQIDAQETIAFVHASVVHEVLLWHDDGRLIDSACSCATFEAGNDCEHIWATILTLQQTIRSAGERTTRGTRATATREPSTPDSLPWTEYLDRVHDLLRTLEPSAFPRQLTGESQLIYQLSFRGEGRLVCCPVVSVSERRRTKNGWGRVRPFLLDGPEVAGPEDRRIVKLLQSFRESETEPGYRRWHRRRDDANDIEVPHPLITTTLAELAGTGRLHLDGELPEDSPPLRFESEPWRFSFTLADAGGSAGGRDENARGDERRGRGRDRNVGGTTGEENDDGVLRLVGEFRRGDERITPEDLTFFFPETPLLVADRRIAPVEPRGAGVWVIGCATAPMTVPAKEAPDAVAAILASGPDTPFELPTKLDLAVVREPPRPRLVVRRELLRGKKSPALVCHVTFDYGDGVVIEPDDAPAAMRRGSAILVRDLEAERARIAELIECGVRRSVRDDTLSQLTIATGRLSELVDTLLARGWGVEAEGRIHRAAGKFAIRVKSGIDWLDLDGSVEFEGVSMAFPRLLGAIRRGRRLVPLGDGSFGVLPEAWLARSGVLAELGEAEGDEVRFRPSQAWLLDALLADVEGVDRDAEFAALRERIRAFEGIRPRREGKGFQGTLRPYQREGIAWLGFLRDLGLGGCLADDMGLGKTVQVIAHLDRLRAGRGLAGPTLVVAPRSVLENWLRELHRFAPRLGVVDFSGPDRDEHADQLDRAQVILTTYAILRRDIASLRKRRFDTVVLDESQAIKNGASQTAKAARLLTADHRIALSGTPIENHLGELWSLFEFLQPGMFGSAKKFRAIGRAPAGDGGAAEAQASGSQTSGAQGSGTRGPGRQSRNTGGTATRAGGEPAASRAAGEGTNGADASAAGAELGLEAIARAVRPFILRRTKARVAPDLPERSEIRIDCPLTPKQEELYEELLAHYRDALLPQVRSRGVSAMAIRVIEALLRLRQAACHPGLLDPERRDEPSGKLDVLLERIEQLRAEGHRCLVFSQFTKFLGIVRTRLDEREIAYEYLDGRTRKRQERIDRFQNEGTSTAFLISLRAGGLGLNLTAADYVFLLDPWWNPASEAQAIDRAHRIGQTEHVFAFRLIAPGTVEEKIAVLQEKKRSLAEAIVRADGLVESLTAEDLEEILEIGWG